MITNRRQDFLAAYLKDLEKVVELPQAVAVIKTTINATLPLGDLNPSLIKAPVSASFWLRVSPDYPEQQRVDIIEVDEHFPALGHLSNSNHYRCDVALLTHLRKEKWVHPKGAYVIHGHLVYFIDEDGLRKLYDAITRGGCWPTGKKLIPG